MVEGVDCSAPCKNRSYNKYRWNQRKGRYELSKLPGAGGGQGTCQADRATITADHKCMTFEHWETLSGRTRP
jgi:hypothetical protein